MKRLLITLAFLLAYVGAFAQGNVRTATLTQSVTAGTVREDQAIDHLTAVNVVETRATVRYTAGQSVTLQPGFVAQAGSVFLATIQPATSALSVEPGTTLTVRAFPNPFETTTTVEYSLPESLRVRQTLTDAHGRMIRQSDGQAVEPVGTHRTVLDLSRLPVGVYLYQVETGKDNQVLRLIKK
ncbi:T9SS type A sorting domain-containing protein [Spirosoma luteum]|uniref:T9SS type A sorting domain-containing protein n=1 Tax=Spirosoma luteum TaxID=431553 RepID=UPI00037C94A2|nr:T9SS type A sorting domain-containing protein [Spirosoma luteum]